MALEYSTLLTPLESLDEAIDQDGIILFGLTANKEPALLSPEVFRSINYTGNINGPYESSDREKLINYGQIQEFFGPNGRGQRDYRGAQGIQGPQGPTGTSTSLRGYQGIAGEDAEVVAQGAQGYQGYQGTQGILGNVQGRKGYTGYLGPGYPLTWEKFTELMTSLGITFVDGGEIISQGAGASQSISAAQGFYQKDRYAPEPESNLLNTQED